jgi:hypothetical protein
MPKAKSKSRSAPQPPATNMTRGRSKQAAKGKQADPQPHCEQQPSFDLQSELTEEQVNRVAAKVVEQLQPVLEGVPSQASGYCREARQPPLEPSNSQLGDVLPILSVNDNLGVHVSQNIQFKIINLEYVDLACIIAPDKSKEQVVSVKDGHLVLDQRQPPKKIASIEAWSDAFMIFISIFGGGMAKICICRSYAFSLPCGR